MRSSAAPSALLLDVVAMFVALGYRVQTSTDVYRGARDMWILAPQGVTLPFAVVRVAATSGRITGAEVRPHGEDRPARNTKGQRDTHAALIDLAHLIESAQAGPQYREAALRHEDIPTVTTDAAAVARLYDLVAEANGAPYASLTA